MRKLTNVSIPLIFAIILVSGCRKEPAQTPSNISVKSQLKSAQIISASNKFGLNLFKAIQQITPDSNLFISPFSSLEALSMTYNGAAGNTKTEMAAVLNYVNYSDSEVNNYNQSLIKALLSADDQVQLEIANSLWRLQGFQFLQSFIDVNKKYYDAEDNELNFSDPSAIVTINNWANSKTHGKVPEILDYIDPNAVMFLINAIYFKGVWKYQFEKSNTISTDFYTEDGSTVQHWQMTLESKLNYYSNDEYQVVELPYGNGTFNFIMILPKAGGSLNDLISGLDEDKWNEITGSLKENDVVIKVPRFKFEMSSLLNNPLKNLGMVSAFGPLTADFSNMDGYDDLYISRVIHKTYIELNEEGTEAAAVTAVEVVEKANLSNNFIANRPFIYAITEKSTGAILFIGKMLDPTMVKVVL